MKRSAISMLSVAAILACLVSSSAFASIGGNTTFGPLADATFGGSGIPNNAVEILTFSVGSDSITLGLTATPRYDAPPVTNNGNGTFYAMAGATPANGFTASLWNFDYYIKVEGNGTYKFKLLYDFDPGPDTDPITLGTIDFPFGPYTLPVIQDSWNLGMNFLANPAIAPDHVPFNPNAVGEYSFVLETYDESGWCRYASSAITVNVATPEPAAIIIWSMLGGLSMVFVWRKRKSA